MLYGFGLYVALLSLDADRETPDAYVPVMLYGFGLLVLLSLYAARATP